MFSWKTINKQIYLHISDGIEFCFHCSKRDPDTLATLWVKPWIWFLQDYVIVSVIRLGSAYICTKCALVPIGTKCALVRAYWYKVCTGAYWYSVCMHWCLLVQTVYALVPIGTKCALVLFIWLEYRIQLFKGVPPFRIIRLCTIPYLTKKGIIQAYTKLQLCWASLAFHQIHIGVIKVLRVLG